MAEGYQHERDQAVLRAPWRPAAIRLLTLDEVNLLGSNPAYRTLLSQLENQFATLAPSDAVALLRAAMTATGAPSVRFLRITGGR
jgi:hypothetical protein